MTKRSSWTPAAPDSEASGPCRTVPGAIMATNRDAFQTYSTGRLPLKRFAPQPPRWYPLARKSCALPDRI